METLMSELIRKGYIANGMLTTNQHPILSF